MTTHNDELSAKMHQQLAAIQDEFSELPQQLRALQDKVLATAPPEVVAMLQKMTADLVQSGIIERSLREGAKAPDFSLPNVRGELVTLSQLLARGPVVLAFYRGYSTVTRRHGRKRGPQARAPGDEKASPSHPVH